MLRLVPAEPALLVTGDEPVALLARNERVLGQPPRRPVQQADLGNEVAMVGKAEDNQALELAKLGQLRRCWLLSLHLFCLILQFKGQQDDFANLSLRISAINYS